MPLWSLTRERIDKLLKLVGDKELEIDELIKLSKEDLWNRDLDEFIAEWRFQLADEEKRQKKVANMGRRASTKLKIGGGPAGRKRKANDSDDDSDFGGVAVKTKKPAAPKQSKQPGGMLAYLNPDPPKATKTSPKSKGPSATTKALMESFTALPKKEKSTDVWMDLDSGSDAPKDTKAKAKATVPAKKAPIAKKKVEADGADDNGDDDDFDEEIVRPTAGRKPRAAATKPVKYNTLDSDSDGDDMLLDVGNMVKGINTTAGATSNSRPLFSASMSRPGSSAGLPKKSAPSKIIETIDDDDTNYSMLAPPTIGKEPAVTAKKTILSDDDASDAFDSMDDIAPAPKAPKPKPISKPAVKPAAKPAAKPKALAAKKLTKPTPQPQEPKKMPLSPAAKAYAAKKVKLAREAAKVEEEEEEDSEDEIEQVANEIMDDGDEDEDEEEPAAARRPARRAAAATASKKKWVISDDEEDEGETGVFEEEDSDD